MKMMIVVAALAVLVAFTTSGHRMLGALAPHHGAQWQQLLSGHAAEEN
jgi:hypothetical protein